MANPVYKYVQEAMIKRIETQIEEMIKNPSKRFSWVRPWDIKGGILQRPFNDDKGTYYKGINLFLLPKSGAYLSYKQLTERGYKLKKKATKYMVVFWLPNYSKKTNDEELEGDNVEVETEEKQTTKKPTSFVLRYYNVYHEDDIEGFERKHHKIEENKEEINEVKLSELQAEAENILKNYCDRESIKLSIIPSSQAYYQPSLDSITIPTKEQYTNLNEYLSTMAHECVHSTGAKHRLNRDLSGGMRTKSYSKEELVAEMGAALILASKGIEDADTEKNSVAYLRGWVSKLKDDITFITFAAQRAQKATNLILGEDKE